MRRSGFAVQEHLLPLPLGWRLVRAKLLFREVDDRSEDGTETLLGLTKENGVVERSSIDQRASIADTYAGYKRCLRGDLVMNKMQAWNGIFGSASIDGLVSPDYTVFRPRNPDIDVRFFEYLFRTSLYAGEFGCRSRGMGTAFFRLNTSEFDDVVVPLPSLGTQRSIAGFLDSETARISALIAKKSRLIELLQEKRTAIITHAVTKGLNPDVRIEDSGVEWLGEVPEHWVISGVKYVSIVDNSGIWGSDLPDGEEGVPVVTTAQIDHLGNIDVSAAEARRLTPSEKYAYLCVPGDIIVVKSCGSATNVISGKCALVKQEHPPISFGNFLMRLRPLRDVVNPAYLFYYLVSDVVKKRVGLMVSTTTYPNLRVQEYTSFELPLPTLSEQQAITDYLDCETTRIDMLTSKIKKSILLMQEYRTALISAAVTGKIASAGRLS